MSKESKKKENTISINNNQDYTVFRCKCKDEYEYLGKKYKKKCILNETETEKGGVWCETKDNCGRYDAEMNRHWDYCSTESMYKPFFEIEQFNYGKNFILYNILGIFIFIILSFVIFIILYKYNKLIGLLFLANIDLLASVLNYNSGPYDSRMFYFNYSNDVGGIWSYISQIVINFIALAAVLYIVLYHHKSENNKEKLLIGLICILFTYFIPNEIIEYVMIKFDTYLYDSAKNEEKRDISLKQFDIKKYILVIGLGIFVAAFFINLEHFIVESIIH